MITRDEGEAVRKPPCRLIGTGSNIFESISRVRETLRAAGQSDKALEFTLRALAAQCEDDVLRLCFQYVEVE